ncbi:MAG TPA: small multi-drug export protein [Candidatus Cloacimonadota bacterium]|nr:small multi-drug export protein [Candidatus Cloacimonadota bacterium]
MKVKFILILLALILCCQYLSAFSLKDSIREKVDNFAVSSEVKVFLISMLPIFELRGAIPVGVLSYHLPYWKVIPLALAGNMVPIFLILLFFDLITKLCFKYKFSRKILEGIFQRTRSKSAVVEKYKEVGLMLFVAIPLPVTGAWTGSLAAYLMGLSFGKSILFIFLGVCIAAVIVSFLTSLKWLGAAIALAALGYFFIAGQLQKKKQKSFQEN